MSWPKIKKKIIFLKCHLLLFYATINYSWSDCDVQCKVHTRTGNDQLTGWTEKKVQSTSQSQTCTRKKVMITVWLVCWFTTAFWTPTDPKYLRSTFKNQWYAQKTAMPADGIGQENGPNSSLWQHPTAYHTTNTSKVEQIGLQSFASSIIFIWLITNQLPLL